MGGARPGGAEGAMEGGNHFIAHHRRRGGDGGKPALEVPPL